MYVISGIYDLALERLIDFFSLLNNIKISSRFGLMYKGDLFTQRFRR